MPWLRPCDRVSTRGFAHNAIYGRLEGLFDELLSPLRREVYLQSRATQGESAIESADLGLDSVNRDDIGPSERSLLHYFNSTTREMTTMIGDLGSGKSTTLAYVLSTLLDKDRTVLLHDFNTYQPQTTTSETEVERAMLGYLADVFAAVVRRLLKPSEEYERAWTWAMGVEVAEHPSVLALEQAFAHLRETLGDDWQGQTPSAIAERKVAASKLRGDPSTLLRYQLMLLDFYTSVQCDGDGRRLIVIFDNLDPLPPNYQRFLFDRCIRLSNYAPFKFVLAMRPATFKRRIETHAGFTTYNMIHHCGPSLQSVLTARIAQIVNASDEDLLRIVAPVTLPFSVRIEGSDVHVGPNQVRAFCANIMNAFESSSNGPSDSPSIIDGVAGNSLRLGLLLAGKVFSANVLPLRDLLDAAPKPKLFRRHEIDRCVLLRGWHCYTPAENRVVDNVFDTGVGTAGAKGNLTCKLRLLYFLQRHRGAGATLGRADFFLRLFGYPTETVLAAVNAVLVSPRRLAISNNVLYVPTISGLESIQLQITPAGSYYIDHAIKSLEYVQEVHYASELPAQLVIEHDPKNFRDRVRSLSLFLAYLADLDQGEVKTFIAESRTQEYIDVFGSDLVSLTIARSIEPALKRVADAIARNRRSVDVYDIQSAIIDWQSMYASKSNAAAGLLKHLRSVGGSNVV
jgi:hypothetical protein